MGSMLQFAGLLITTIFTAAAAAAFQWVFLHAAFQMMRPATARTPRPVRSELVRGTRELIRHVAPQR